MNRDLWASFPASTAEEKALLGAMDGASARRNVTAVRADGYEQALAVVVSIEVEAPFDGKADVVARLSFDGEGPGEGSHLLEEPWELLDRFLRETEAEARRRAAAAR